ncbi:MAG: helicase associated domain-containing protein [Clostridia bacterium]|nr:helicase associated domain-containing protein [Clostridia bacterium]
MTEEQIRLLEDIGIVWETGSEDIWYRYYEETRAFFIANQHLIVPKANNVYLNRWINQQRKAFQKGQLSKQQITMLENIGMQWELSDPWKNGYVHAQQYYEQNDNLLVPVKYECGDGYKLGFWIKTQRQQYSEGVISEDQIQRLESIGMVWNSQNHSWQNSYQMAKNFFEKHRHLNVLRDYKKEINYDLNEWFRQQREADRNGALTDDRRKLLEDIEFDWLYPTERA